MSTTIELNGKPLTVTLDAPATRALAARETPLLAEMELYFSCLIRKQVRFHEHNDGTDTAVVSDKLRVRFHPVMSQVCGIDDHPDGPPLADFPIVRGERFSPNWLRISFRDGHWSGSFGY